MKEHGKNLVKVQILLILNWKEKCNYKMNKN